MASCFRPLWIFRPTFDTPLKSHISQDSTSGTGGSGIVEARDNTGTVAGDVDEAEVTEAMEAEQGGTTEPFGVEHALDTVAVDVATDAITEAVDGTDDEMKTGTVFWARFS